MITARCVDAARAWLVRADERFDSLVDPLESEEAEQPFLQLVGAPGQLAACHLHVVGTPVSTTPDGGTAEA